MLIASILRFKLKNASLIDGKSHGKSHVRHQWVGGREELILAYEPVMVMARRDERTAQKYGTLEGDERKRLACFFVQTYRNWCPCWLMYVDVISHKVWNKIKTTRRFQASSGVFFGPICTIPHVHYWYVVLNLPRYRSVFPHMLNLVLDRVTERWLDMVEYI